MSEVETPELTKSPTILIVDDEEGILDLMETLLVMEGYEVLRAENGDVALSACDGRQVDAILSDYRMPGMNGVELFSKLKTIYPDAPRILITGVADVDITMEAINRGGAHRFMRKPWDPEELINEVKTALEHSMVVREKQRLQDLLEQQNEELEEKVNERTSELKETVKDLQDANETITATYQQLLQSDKLSTLGLMAGTIAHDIANPLTVILTRVKLLSLNNALTDADRDQLEVILRNGKRIETLIRSITRFAKRSKGEYENVDIREVIKESLIMMSKAISTKGISIREDYNTEQPFVFGNLNQLEQVITNLIQNGVQAIESTGELTLTLNRHNGMIRTVVEDTGPGIPEENIDSIFEAFFTTKAEGTGLGLNICRRIVKEHSGEISVESEEGRGTRFIVDLPVYKNGD